ncbi:hypothetical protein [Caldovatus aquaticus]|uniref:Heme-binding protein n=1 Tax=Caldovatus aquaticus TaxID=2865671 RepID=A0ABS7F0H0_9PROT|nr:hypothetical protein [Caldovatus aquaticus]MBW8268296.1 hypothetical protein [Caldovatus aquaticus]
MRRRPLRVIAGGPSREVAGMVAGTIARLRRGDCRAMAVVLVRADGSVEAGYAGHRDGHFFRLSGGMTDLLHRLHRER